MGGIMAQHKNDDENNESITNQIKNKNDNSNIFERCRESHTICEKSQPKKEKKIYNFVSVLCKQTFH